MRVITEVDRIVRRRTVALPRISTENILAERAARNRDRIAVRGKGLRRIGSIVVTARTAIDPTFDRAARDREDISRDRAVLMGVAGIGTLFQRTA